MKAPKQLSTTKDFSPATIARQTLQTTLEHPSVIYPAVLGVLGVVGALTFDASLRLVGLGAVGLLASTGSWGINFGLRRDEFARRYVQRMTREIEENRQARLKSIEQALHDMNSADGKSQFKRLREKFSTFRDMLDKKLDSTELAHARYLGMAEQVYPAALDNLNTVVNLLRSLAVIDRKFIDKRLAELAKQQDSASMREREALVQRRALYEHLSHGSLDNAEMQAVDMETCIIQRKESIRHATAKRSQDQAHYGLPPS